MAKKKNKTLPIVVAAVAVVGVVGGVIAWRMSKGNEPAMEEEAPTTRRRISVPTNVIAISERPYIEVIPFTGREGRSLRIVIETIEKDAKEAEYVLETEVGGASAKNAAGRDIGVPETENPVGLQGSMGIVDISSLPAQAESLLGSCSAGGACIHYSGLGGGRVQITFSGGGENYAVASGFNYIENTSRTQTKATSKDGLFTIEGKALERLQNYVITNSAGLPSGLEGEVIEVNDEENERDGAKVVLAYQLSSTETAPSGTMTVTIEGEGVIYAYDKKTKAWTALETEMSAGVASAQTEWADIFALVR
ncbi:hypothetical protein FWH30_03600 [Microgenomates group bacterium]|nr:hypothetical protein [Microgenomates group bacterium]